MRLMKSSLSSLADVIVFPKNSIKINAKILSIVLNMWFLMPHWFSTLYTRNIFTKMYPRHLKTHTNSVMNTFTNFVWCSRKVFFKISTWIVGRDSMKRHCQKRKNFTGTWYWQTTLILITNTPIKFGKIFKCKTYMIIIRK